MDSTSPSNRPALHKLRKGCANRTGKVSHNRYHTCGKQERGSNNCPSQKAGTQPKKTREQSSKNSHIIATQESRTSDCLGGNFGRPKTCQNLSKSSNSEQVRDFCRLTCYVIPEQRRSRGGRGSEDRAILTFFMGRQVYLDSTESSD